MKIYVIVIQLLGKFISISMGLIRLQDKLRLSWGLKLLHTVRDWNIQLESCAYYVIWIQMDYWQGNIISWWRGVGEGGWWLLDIGGGWDVGRGGAGLSHGNGGCRGGWIIYRVFIKYFPLNVGIFWMTPMDMTHALWRTQT